MQNDIFFNMEIPCLLSKEKILSWTFWRLEIRSFLSKKLLVTEKFLFWTFRGWKLRSFFIQKVNGRIMVFLLVFLWFLQIFLEHLHWLLLQFALLQLAVKMLELYFTLLNFSLPAKPRFKNDQMSRLPTQDPLRSTTKNLFYSAIDSDLVVT